MKVFNFLCENTFLQGYMTLEYIVSGTGLPPEEAKQELRQLLKDNKILRHDQDASFGRFKKPLKAMFAVGVTTRQNYDTTKNTI